MALPVLVIELVMFVKEKVNRETRFRRRSVLRRGAEGAGWAWASVSPMFIDKFMSLLALPLVSVEGVISSAFCYNCSPSWSCRHKLFRGDQSVASAENKMLLVVDAFTIYLPLCVSACFYVFMGTNAYYQIYDYFNA